MVTCQILWDIRYKLRPFLGEYFGQFLPWIEIYTASLGEIEELPDCVEWIPDDYDALIGHKMSYLSEAHGMVRVTYQYIVVIWSVTSPQESLLLVLWNQV